jgi:hypothetical protein
MELWNWGDICSCVRAVESFGALEQLWRVLEQLHTTTLKGEPLNCSLCFFWWSCSLLTTRKTTCTSSYSCFSFSCCCLHNSFQLGRQWCACRCSLGLVIVVMFTALHSQKDDDRTSSSSWSSSCNYVHSSSQPKRRWHVRHCIVVMLTTPHSSSQLGYRCLPNFSHLGKWRHVHHHIPSLLIDVVLIALQI